MEEPPRQTPVIAAAVACTSAFAAFLLFQVQPMAAKRLLPALGGSAGVWTACMLFFQGVLLLAYAYAHLLARFRTRVAASVHGVVLVLAVAALPLAIDTRVVRPEAPIAGLLLALAKSVGLPYFALSATTPLVESFMARRRSTPFRLFAVSNAGSLAALLSYPILVEPFVSLPAQLHAWSLGFYIYAAPMALILVLGAGEDRAAGAPERTREGPLRDRLMWTALGCAASLLLLTTTTQLSVCIAPIPLLWVVPLAVYLVSFIVTFAYPAAYRGAYRRGPLLGLSAIALALLGMDVSLIEVSPFAKIALVTLSLLVACTAAHGELVAMRPARAPTAFYLSISLGGALGGVFAALLAPALFNTPAERPLAAVFLAGLLITRLIRDGEGITRRAPLFLALGLSILFVGAVASSGASVAAARNFYGSIRIVDKTEAYGRERRMVHGGIIHGVESLDPARAGEPMSYFTRQSGLARAIAFTQRSGNVRFGVVGLGIGSSLEYLRPGDHARVYELDPLVVDMASRYFTIVPRHAAQTSIVIGDGRTVLAREEPQGFDVLALDAFSGDAVPVHLLSREAFTMYATHVKPSGFICVHITNLYVDLQPVVREAARVLGWHARSVVSPANERGGKRAHWILLNRDASVFSDEALSGNLELPAEPALEPWSDDWSSVWRVVRRPHGL